jgi:head-tail adaptor
VPGALTVGIRKRPGQRRHRVELQEGVFTFDETHGRTQTWPPFGNDWAAVDVLPDVQTETEATVFYQVALKYRADVPSKFNAGTSLRIATAGLTLKVLAVVNAELRNIELVLHCARDIATTT